MSASSSAWDSLEGLGTTDSTDARATISLVPEKPDFDEITQKFRAAPSTSEGKTAGLSSKQIAMVVGLTTRAIRARMTALAERGLVTVTTASTKTWSNTMTTKANFAEKG